MRSSRTSTPRLGSLGALAAVTALICPAPMLVSSTEPIVETLEFSDAGVLSYGNAIVADHSANTDDPAFTETALAGAELQVNELFVRYLPDTGVADVFISLMIAGQLDGCDSSMSTLNQTTADPVVVDDAGTATAVIEAAWTWTRQLNQGGVCFEKAVVAQWTETYTIDLNFAGGRTSATVAYADRVESLGSTPPAEPSVQPGAADVTTPSSPVAPSVISGATPSGVDAPSGDVTVAEDDTSAPQGERAGDESGGGPSTLAIIGLGIAVLLMLWAFFSVNRLRQMLVAVIRMLSRSPKPGPPAPEVEANPLHKTYGDGDTRVTYQTSIAPVPAPLVSKIVGTAQSDYRYVDARAEHGERTIRLETGTTVEVLERTQDRALVRLPGEGTTMWVYRKDIQTVNPTEPSADRSR